MTPLALQLIKCVLEVKQPSSSAAMRQQDQVLEELSLIVFDYGTESYSLWPLVYIWIRRGLR